MSSWLDTLIRRSARELEAQGKTRFQFGHAISAALDGQPLQEWELGHWARGLKTGLIRLKGHYFRAGTGRRSALSMFVRNDQGLYVGLRREAITQAATYVMLITDYGYSRRQTRVESRWMDVAVYGEDGRPYIYAENKATSKILETLCVRLSTDFQCRIPIVADDEKAADDAIMKAGHIWRNRPRYFWAVSPTRRQSFKIRYAAPQGFSLERMDSLPSALEWAGGDA